MVSGSEEADVVLGDVNIVDKNTLPNTLDYVNNDSLILISNSITYVYKYPSLMKEITIKGFIKSWLPIDGDIDAFIKEGFNEEF